MGVRGEKSHFSHEYCFWEGDFGDDAEEVSFQNMGRRVKGLFCHCQGYSVLSLHLAWQSLQELSPRLCPCPSGTMPAVVPRLLPGPSESSRSLSIQASLQPPSLFSTSTALGAEPGPGFSQGCFRPVGGSPAGRWPGSGENPVLLIQACSCGPFPGKHLHVWCPGSGGLFGFCCFCFSVVSGCWVFSFTN